MREREREREREELKLKFESKWVMKWDCIAGGFEFWNCEWVDQSKIAGRDDKSHRLRTEFFGL
jgi:hypothetical protein